MHLIMLKKAGFSELRTCLRSKILTENVTIVYFLIKWHVLKI